MLKFIKSFFDKRKKNTRIKKIIKHCGCVCYCTQCHNPLNDGVCEELTPDIYRYTCGECGHKSVFHFGIAPCPIALEKA